MRHTVCSVLKINISSQDMQEIIIYKTIKKNLYCNQQRYFKWGHNHFQQQLPELFYKNAVLKFCNILRKTPVLESPSGLHLWVSDFIKKRLQHRNFWEHLYRRTAERCSVIKRNCWMCYYQFSSFHAQTCTTNMRRATHIGCWISNRSK